MNISLSWLKDYIKTDLTAQEIAKILTSIGLEVGHVSEYESVKGGLAGLVIGEVKTCIAHENSDHLHVTTVDIGADETLQIVCGAPNVAQGQKVVVATIGTKLYSGDEAFVIKRSKIRGVESFGMICSETEIGVGNSSDGIIVLPSDAVVGTLAKDYYQVETDSVIEVDITPNRSDAISHYGVARDLHAYCNTHGISSMLVRPQEAELPPSNGAIKINVKVKNSAACPRYAGISLTGVTVAQSPEWLQNRLKSIGLSPINNVVDITNYLLHSFGQPLHAFDADAIEGKTIVVRNALNRESFVTLDNVQRTLTDTDLMICDAQKPICMAGIFGGLQSGVSKTTKSIFIESAYFNPVSTRKSARHHGLNTDSSFRFERGINPHDTIYVLRLAASMVVQIAGGSIASDIIDIYPKQIEDFMVDVSLKKIYSLIGQNIDTQTIENILKGLEIDILAKNSDNSVKDTVYRLKVPAYRTDVQRDIDVIEEILRIYGYDKIEISQSVKTSLSYSRKPDRHSSQNIISEQLTANGFYEIMNNSFSKSQYYDNLTTYPAKHNVSVMNALSNDLNVMRQTLLFGGLESMAYNINRQNGNLKFYEFGNCYRYSTDSKSEGNDPLDAYTQSEHLGLWITGKKLVQSWLHKEEKTSFYDLKAYMQNIFLRLGIKKLSVKEIENNIFVQALEYSTASGKRLAVAGIVSKDILKIFDIKDEVFYADILWDEALALSADRSIKFDEISKFPEVSRDLALLVDKNISFGQIESIAFATEKRLLRRVTLFDVYEGKNLEEGKKSYAVNFILQDNNKTLTDSQIDSIMCKLQKNFEQQLDAKIR
ncbi:phenylalanyl-tRNA synthetase subunit beta [Porphyromonadaceae bacterium COT-184 OH4590]|nr:phenylalanyl-tRNA synthetase subunit beta [Porphyromonadaceae bacterium COT-184 OH4590]